MTKKRIKQLYNNYIKYRHDSFSVVGNKEHPDYTPTIFELKDIVTNYNKGDLGQLALKIEGLSC